jgi:phosphatidylglycerol:prolipoprotein diacylglycerol transferase
VYPFVHVAGLAVSSFTLCLILLFAVAGGIALADVHRRRLPTDAVWDAALWCIPAGMLGARLYWVLAHPAHSLTSPAAALLHGGLTFYGGAIAGVAVAYWRWRRSALPSAPFFDTTALVLPAGHVIGRIGCFLAGDDYGLPTTGPLGVAFPHGAPPSTAGHLRALGASVAAAVPDDAVLRVHPVQLYEACGDLLIFAALWRVAHRTRRPYAVFALYLLLYGLLRFALEFVRAKDDRVLVGGALTISQVISALAAAAGIAIALRARRAAAASGLAPAAAR